MHLYTTFEGFGWETGQRVYEVPAGGYTRWGAVEIKNAGGYILYAANTRSGRDIREPYLFWTTRSWRSTRAAFRRTA